MVLTIVDEPQQYASVAATLHRVETSIASYQRKNVCAGLKYANYVKDVYLAKTELDGRHLNKRLVLGVVTDGSYAKLEKGSRTTDVPPV